MYSIQVIRSSLDCVPMRRRISYRDRKRNISTYIQLALPGAKVLNTFERSGHLMSPKTLPSSTIDRMTSKSSCFFRSTENSLRHRSLPCGAYHELLKLMNLKKMLPQTCRFRVSAAQNHRAEIAFS